MTQFKKGISLLLLIAVLLSAAPITAQATETEANEAAAGSRYTIVEHTEPEGRQYYGRTVLESMENTALLYAYDQLVEGVENAEAEISVYNGLFPITQDEVNLVMDVYRRDYAHHFWLGNGYGVSYNPQTVLSVVPTYLMTGDTLTEARAKFNAEADAILSGITEDMTQYEKELYLHDTLAQRITYKESTNAHNAYGALVEGVAVCEGYAEAFQYLLHRAGIWSYLVLGSSRGVGHAWNMVQIDGEYYHVDLTWNDQDEVVYHGYFNVTDAQILKDHTIDATTYTLPSCTSADAFYYTGKDTYLSTYTVAGVAKLLRDNDLQVNVYIPGDVETFVDWYRENILQIAQTAGVYGSFSYGYSQLGNELIIKIKKQVAKVTVGTDVAYYNDLSVALQNCSDGAQLRLMDDLSEGLTTNLQITLDLNGYDIAGDLIATAAVTVLDRQTADYTVENGNGYGVIYGTVTGVAPAAGYIVLSGEEGTSFHKVDVALEKLTLNAQAVGLYYTGSFLYDEIIAESVEAYGVTMSTACELPVADDSDSSCLYTLTARSVLLKDIMSPDNTVDVNRSNGKKLIYSRAYLKLADGTYLYSDVSTANLQTMVETVDAKAWDRLSDAQREMLLTMYQTYSEVMDAWDIPNLKSA